MNHLGSLLEPSKTLFQCFCLTLERGAPTDHMPDCPNPQLLHTPFNMAVEIQNPKMFQKSPIVCEGGRNTGFTRITKFMDVLNHIRSHVTGCTIFYSVNDALLRHMVAQLLPVIVGDTAFLENPGVYYQYAQIPVVPVRSFITTARQIGKTTTMAIAITALLCVADGMDLCKIYARTQNQAVNLLTEVKSIFFRLPTELRPAQVLKQNETVLSVVSESNGQACVVSASPGNVEGIRGHKPRVIVVDEYQFTLPEFWTQHIWALTQVTSRILICASTPGTPGSYMAAETNKMKIHPILYPESRVLDYSLVCQRHRDDDTPLLCRCKLEFLPPWKNVSAIRQAQGQYGDGNSGDFIQEVLGEPVSSGTRIFDPKKVAATFSSSPETISHTPQGYALYVAIDPSGGGESEMAICSILYTHQSQILLVGLDSALTKKLGAVEITAFVRAHLRRLRQIPILKNIVLVPIVEDQGGVPMAHTICDVFKEPEFQTSAFLFGHTVTGIHSRGVPTTKAIKENMVFLIETLLNDSRIKTFVDATTTGTRNAQSPVGNTPFCDLKAILATQMANLFYDEKRHVTGKLGPGFKDDLVMAFMLAVYWSNKIRTQDSRLVTGNLAF